jgi:nucleoside-triphosphatase THEP1
MNKNQSIYIFSKSIRSGKTTQLMEWLKHRSNVGGFLTPDVEGMRMLFDIGKQKMHPFQVMENYAGPVVSIGRFRFSIAIFNLGKNIIANASPDLGWFMIDEVGKLEVEQGEGFEPEILRIVKRFQSEEMNGNLLLVVRDTLLTKTIEKYDLEGCSILNNDLPA